MTAAGISCFGTWSKIIASPPDVTAPAVHNMLILGTKTPFLYHLPLFSFKGFDSPHRYQVILEASFGEFQDVYGRARAEDPPSSKRLYSFSPDKFVLTQLNQSSPLTKLTGTVFRGHLEKGGTVLGENVKAEVKRIYFQEFKAPGKKPTQLQYIIFGRRPEIFMAHLITQPPDFDQILSLKDLGTFEDDELSRGLKIFFSRRNTIAQRVTQGSFVTGQIEVVRGGKKPIRTRKMSKVAIVTEDYLEEGELRVAPAFATTTFEKAAGFP